MPRHCSISIRAAPHIHATRANISREPKTATVPRFGKNCRAEKGHNVKKQLIERILPLRSDLSPFLVHLTRSHPKKTAHDCLRDIITFCNLFSPSMLRQEFEGFEDFPEGLLSDARFAVALGKLTKEEWKQFFGAISFTETPIREIHRLFDIAFRKINLEPYGLVFLKDRLINKGVSPAIYLNNAQGDKDAIVRALASLIDTHPNEAAQILPLIAVFGKELEPVGAKTQKTGYVDFTWEREWRLPYATSPSLAIEEDDVFLGLCPADEIEELEKLFHPVQFIDPRLDVKQYAGKINKARVRLKVIGINPF